MVGLTTAILAQEDAQRSVRYPRFPGGSPLILEKVVILAEYFAADPKSIHYTSSWAGAHHVSVATPQEQNLHNYDRATFERMHQMIKDDPSVPLMLRNQVELREHIRDDEPDQLTLLETFQPDFKYLPADSLPEGVTHGASFKTIM